jgi:hypothetical protein
MQFFVGKFVNNNHYLLSTCPGRYWDGRDITVTYVKITITCCLLAPAVIELGLFSGSQLNVITERIKLALH